MSQIEYIALEWDPCDPPYEVVRTHTDRETARAVCEHECGWPDESDDFEIDHRYARWIPRKGRHGCELVLCERGPGAFAVTLVEEAQS